MAAVQRLDPAVDVIHVGDPGAPAIGTLDPAILLYCEQEQRALITRNRKSMPGHEKDHFKAGRHHWGIFRIRPNYGIGTCAIAVHLLWTSSEAEEWMDVSEWIPW